MPVSAQECPRVLAGTTAWVILVAVGTGTAQAAPPPQDIRLDPDVLLGGVSADIVCDANSLASGGEIVLVGEPESSPEELRDLGRLLMSQGHPVIIPRLGRAAPSEAADRLERLMKNYERTILARGSNVPCAAIRHCNTNSGVVGEPLQCTHWSAPPPLLFVVLGAGVLSYVELLRSTGCKRPYVAGTLVDPDVRGASLPSLRCDGVHMTAIRTSAGSCHDGFSDLRWGPFENIDLQILTLPNIGHCDAVYGGAACASRCGVARSSAKSSFLWDKVVESFSTYHGLSPALDTPDLKREYSEGSEISSKTKIGLGFLGGAGARTREGESVTAVGIAALRPEVLFGTRGAKSWAYGFYGEAGWLGASTVSLGGGLSLVVPLGSWFTATPSVGVFTHDRHDGWQTGGAASILLGARNRNTYHALDEATGFRFEARTVLSPRPERAFFLAYQFDLFSLAARIGYGLGGR